MIPFSMEKTNLTTHTQLILVGGNKTSNMYGHQQVQTVSKKSKRKIENLSPLILPSPSPQG